MFNNYKNCLEATSLENKIIYLNNNKFMGKVLQKIIKNL